MFTSEYDNITTNTRPKPPKKRGFEISNVIAQQNLALKENIDLRVRKFYQKDILIETFNGHPIKVKIWTSDDKMNLKKSKINDISNFNCDVCGKEFEEKKKLLIHSRCHKKNKEKESNLNYVAGKQADNNRASGNIMEDGNGLVLGGGDVDNGICEREGYADKNVGGNMEYSVNKECKGDSIIDSDMENQQISVNIASNGTISQDNANNQNIEKINNGKVYDSKITAQENTAFDYKTQNISGGEIKQDQIIISHKTMTDNKKTLCGESVEVGSSQNQILNTNIEPTNDDAMTELSSKDKNNTKKSNE